MSWIDWAIVSFALFAGLQGLRRGVFAALIGVPAVIVSYLIASALYQPTGSLIHRYLRLSPGWSATVAFAMLLFLFYNVVAVLTVMAIGSERVPAPSRFLGMAVGAFRGVVLGTAVLIIALASPPGQPLRRDVGRSAIAPHTLTAYRGALRSLAKIFPRNMQPFGIEEMRRF